MAVNNDKLFSRAALDKMRSPEKLDTLLPITTPSGWMGLAAVCLLLFSVVIWSIFGAFTVRAEGVGLIMDSAGVVNISHFASGKIDELFIKTGARVRKGDLIASIEQTEQLADTRMAEYGAELAQNKRDIMGRVYQYDAKKYQQSIIEDIYSEYDGIVDEVNVHKGSIISSGVPLCTIRLTQKREDFNGVFYIPVEKGKRVEPGMTMQLAPNGVDVSESGSLIGVVRSVSQYPVSLRSIEENIGNAQLAQYILSTMNGAAIEISFDLVKDKESESGYLWTSMVGEHKKITAGSFCTGSIIIERRPPIEKVFYKISQWLRSR